MIVAVDAGQKYNRLTVVEQVPKHKTKQKRWKCLCDCGNYTQVDSYLIKTGQVKSCGCLQIENRYLVDHKVHGQWQSRTYHTWEGMKQRCLNPNATRYPDYGAIGVTVCEDWLDFKNFYRDMGDRPEGKTLDRINPFGNYEKENCRWATPYEQQHNQRRHKTGRAGL